MQTLESTNLMTKSEKLQQKLFGKKKKMIHDSLKIKGYKILVIWEQDLLKDTENTIKKILKFTKN